MLDLVGNPEDRFSHDEAHIVCYRRLQGVLGMTVTPRFLSSLLVKGVRKTEKRIMSSLLTLSDNNVVKAGRYSSVGRDVAWESRGIAVDPRVWRIFS